MKGNALDMAAGIRITSFATEILMPPLDPCPGKGHAKTKAAKDAGAATSNCGIFSNTVVDFVLPAFAVFPVGQAGQQVQTPGAGASARCNEPSEL